MALAVFFLIVFFGATLLPLSQRVGGVLGLVQLDTTCMVDVRSWWSRSLMLLLLGFSSWMVATLVSRVLGVHEKAKMAAGVLEKAKVAVCS